MRLIETQLARVLSSDSAPGIALIGAAVLALIIVNSELQTTYDAFLATVGIWQVGSFSIEKPLLLWINDGLMAVFFFFVGLEIKREVLDGRLSTLRSATLPIAAALGGVVVPSLIYVGFNLGDPVGSRGWAIPAATDIAFALGVLALLGTRAPPALKVFLLAVAVIDDLLAILIIAFFYTENLSGQALAVAALGVSLLFAMNRLRIASLGPYIIVGLVVWAAVLKSGIHATLAGVIIAFAIPSRDARDSTRSPLADIEHWLKPWVLFLIMPVFAFANAGVPLTGLKIEDFLAPIPLGIAVGLFVGKQVGVFGFTWLAVRFRLATLPTGLSWRQVYGVSLLAGVGFTMSLFIGSLAFAEPEQQNAVRLGVLVGSALSATAGYLMLRFAVGRTEAKPVLLEPGQPSGLPGSESTQRTGIGHL